MNALAVDLSEDTSPAHGKVAFVCPNCNTYANQVWRDLYWQPNPQGGFTHAVETMRYELIPGTSTQTPVYEGVWMAAECARCKEFTTWRDKQLVYPRASGIVAPSADMGPLATELYNEARDVLPMSRRAGTALARATLERVLKDLDLDAPARADLVTRIGRMDGKVSSSLWRMLTVIRHVGNKTIHPEDEPDDAVILVLDEDRPGMVELIFASINQIVDELVTRPAMVEGFLGLVPDRVKDGVPGLAK